MLLLTLSFACSDGGGATTDLTGTIEVDGMSADVAASRAFAYGEGGRMLVVFASNDASSCAGVAGYLTTGDPFDPIDVFTPNACNVTLVLDGWDGGFSATDDRIASASSAIECAFGDGEFALEDRDAGTDYYWTGDWWVGFPVAYDWMLSGGDGDAVTADITMSSYEGNFVYDTDLDPDPGSGEVSGVVSAEWCDALGDSFYF